MSILVLKIALTVFIFIFGASGLLTPRLFNPFGDTLSYANLVSAGVILSAAMVHLLSDASSKLSQYETYPWAFVIAGLSFLALFAFERFLVHVFLHKTHHHHHHGDHDGNDKQETGSTADINTKLNIHHDHHHGDSERNALDTFELMQEKMYFSAIILFCGLGLHSILAGLALGSSLQNEEIIVLGIAILSHKFLAAFAIGCSLYKSRVGKSLKKSVFIATSFGLLTPSGIIIGLCIQNEIDTFISNIFVSIAAGALLYTSIIEILMHEFSEEKVNETKMQKSYQSINQEIYGANKCDAKWNDYKDAIKICCVFIGFGIMSLLALWL